ncbi:MAG: F0F1 ATP synthase subunit B [Kiloniellales bacterium]|jgi:F-type H+-transporting ATPase subunit b|nr:F0F1 ATP synthase subunit B [Kiloniellales bacterium]
MSELLHSAEFWVLVAFLILVGAVFKKVSAVLTSGLDARAARIKAQLDEAEKLREDAQSLVAEYQRKQRAAGQEAEAIVAQAKSEAERMRQQAHADLEQALKRRQQQALDKIAQAEAEALEAVRNQAVDLALAASARLLADNLDETKAARLVDQAIEELPGKLH